MFALPLTRQLRLLRAPVRARALLRACALLRPQRPSSHGARVTLNWNAAGFLERRAPSGLMVSTR